MEWVEPISWGKREYTSSLICGEGVLNYSPRRGTYTDSRSWCGGPRAEFSVTRGPWHVHDPITCTGDFFLPIFKTLLLKPQYLYHISLKL
jgi:hypothetical protein